MIKATTSTVGIRAILHRLLSASWEVMVHGYDVEVCSENTRMTKRLYFGVEFILRIVLEIHKKCYEPEQHYHAVRRNQFFTTHTITNITLEASQ
jgi:hypothetical protein